MASAEHPPKPDDDRPAMDEATHPFAGLGSSMERNDPLFSEDYEGWWVSTEGDLFTECASCGDTFPAYTVTRFLDGRDLALADRRRRAAAVGAAEPGHLDLSTCRVFCGECDTLQPEYRLRNRTEPTGTPCTTCLADSDERWLNAAAVASAMSRSPASAPAPAPTSPPRPAPTMTPPSPPPAVKCAASATSSSAPPTTEASPSARPAPCSASTTEAVQMLRFLRDFLRESADLGPRYGLRSALGSARVRRVRRDQEAAASWAVDEIFNRGWD